MDSKTGSRKPGSDHTLELAFARTPEAAGRNLLFFSNGLLLAYAQDECNLKSERAQCVAELFLREFLKKGSAGKEIDSILPDGELSAFHLCWGDSREKKDSPFLLPSWQEKNDFSRLCKVEVRKRLTELREKTDGFIPVYLKDDAFFIPFRLVENARSGDVIVDLAGRPFESWTEPCARVFRLAEKDLGKTPGYQCVVSCDQSGLPGFLGNSLMLPLYLACLRKAGKIHYNPLRVLATGAIDDNGMITAVETMEKLTGFRAHFDDACFFFPESANSDSSKRHEIALPRMDLARITGILESYVNAFGLSALPGRDASPGFCSIRLPVSKNFVGRSEELINLDERICRSGRIPVLTGDAGAGKTELAVAFAYRYAHHFPQGRFLVPMEGVATWADAMGKLVEMCEVNCRTSPEELGLPENFSKLRPEEKRTAVCRMLANRAKKGALLLLLDNLDNTDLLSETGLRELAGPTGLPDRLHMIATTRRNESLRADFADPVVLVEVGNLKEKDALELFCQIGKNVYQFANCPMGADGRLRFDKLPEDSRPTEDRIREIEQEYAALQEIVRQLECHAWSLEIVASYFAFFISKFGKCDIRKEWSRIRDRLGSLNGKTHRSEKNAGILLQPTFDLILKSDGQGNELGQKIMRLAEFASFFPPEQIPGYALGALWRSEFGDMEIMIEQDGMTVCGNAFNYALTLLKTYRIIHGGDNGDDGAAMFKMHRLTRDVLQNRLSEDAKLEQIGIMRRCLDSFLDNNPEPISQQLLPWCGWAEEWANRIPALQRDHDYLGSLLTLSYHSTCLQMYAEAGRILSCKLYNELPDQRIKARYLDLKGCILCDLDQLKEAECLLTESLAVQRSIASGNNMADCSFVAKILNDLAILHRDINQYEKAKEEYLEALEIRRNLSKKDPESISSVAKTLSGLAILYRNLNCPCEAEDSYREALEIYRDLAKAHPNRYSSNVAMVLNNYAVFCEDNNHYDEAKEKNVEALEIRRNQQKDNPERYSPYVALALHNLARIHRRLKCYEDAKKEYSEALEIYQKLAKDNPCKYNPDVARMLNGLGNLYFEFSTTKEAEATYSEALKVYRSLADSNPDKYNSDVAMVLNNLGRLHCVTRDYDKAKSEYLESIRIHQDLVRLNPEKFSGALADVMHKIAYLHVKSGQNKDAEYYYSKSLGLYRRLAKRNAEKYGFDLATVLHNLACLHQTLKQVEKSETEYSEALEIRRHFERTNPMFGLDVAGTLFNLAILHQTVGSYAEAEAEYIESLEIQKKIMAISPQGTKHRGNELLGNYAGTLTGLAHLHKTTECFSEAEKEYYEALEIYRKLADKDLKNNVSSMVSILNHVANMHLKKDLYAEAEAECLEALALCRRFAKTNPEICNPDLAMLFNTLAEIHIENGHLQEAEAECTEALSIRRRLAVDNPDIYLPKVAIDLNAISKVHMKSARYDKAEADYYEKLLICRKLAEKNPDVYLTDVAEALDSLAGVHEKLGRADDAEKERQEAAEIRKKMSSDKH